MIFTIKMNWKWFLLVKCIGNDFYHKNALANDFYYKDEFKIWFGFMAYQLL